ncbi:unnamed protein product, partial [marine sediment metagenome]
MNSKKRKKEKNNAQRFILFGLNGGIGNVMETVPLYLGLVELFGAESIRVIYIKEYDTDTVQKCDLYPTKKKVEEVSYQDFLQMFKEYEYTVKTPMFIYDKGADYIKENLDAIRSRDSEYVLNMKILRYFLDTAGVSLQSRKNPKL